MESKDELKEIDIKNPSCFILMMQRELMIFMD